MKMRERERESETSRGAAGREQLHISAATPPRSGEEEEE